MAVEASAPLLRMIWPDDVAELDLAPPQGAGQWSNTLS